MNNKSIQQILLGCGALLWTQFASAVPVSDAENNSATTLTSMAQGWMASADEFDTESLTKVYTDVNHTIYANKIVTKVTKAWYYPTKAQVQESGYETLNYNQLSETVTDFQAFSVTAEGRITWVTAENIKEIEHNEDNFKKYDFLLKLFDKANIINEINLD